MSRICFNVSRACFNVNGTATPLLMNGFRERRGASVFRFGFMPLSCYAIVSWLSGTPVSHHPGLTFSLPNASGSGGDGLTPTLLRPSLWHLSWLPPHVNTSSPLTAVCFESTFVSCTSWLSLFLRWETQVNTVTGEIVMLFSDVGFVSDGTDFLDHVSYGFEGFGLVFVHWDITVIFYSGLEYEYTHGVQRHPAYGGGSLALRRGILALRCVMGECYH